MATQERGHLFFAKAMISGKSVIHQRLVMEIQSDLPRIIRGQIGEDLFYQFHGHEFRR